MDILHTNSGTNKQGPTNDETRSGSEGFATSGAQHRSGWIQAGAEWLSHTHRHRVHPSRADTRKVKFGGVFIFILRPGVIVDVVAIGLATIFTVISKGKDMGAKARNGWRSGNATRTLVPATAPLLIYIDGDTYQ
jgi:hypothetical protein